MQNPGTTGHSGFFRALMLTCPLLLLLLIPLHLSNHPSGTAFGGFVLLVVLFFPGYLLLSVLRNLPDDIHFVLSPVFGLACVTAIYDAFARASMRAYFPYFAAVLCAGGMIAFAMKGRLTRRFSWHPGDGPCMILAGSVIALSVGPLFWRSGRFSGGEFVFYGPAGQDQLFHVTLLQRLAQHVPPDNFIVSGVRATVYHYFGDLTMALVLWVETALHLPATDLFDLYYRSYPTIVYFLIGALAYLAGRQLVGRTRDGILGVLLLLGGGGLGWLFGILQTSLHLRQLGAARGRLFSTWTQWDGVDAIRALVHRPAHYYGLLITLSAINLLLRPERTRRDWYMAGLLLGVMAGFNYTLAATFGIAAVMGSLLLFVQHRNSQAHDLAGLALFLFLGSLPLNIGMLSSGFHNMAPGFPFHGPNLEFPLRTWGGFLSPMPNSLVPWTALILLPIFAYGIKLFGIRSLMRLSLGDERHHGLAALFAFVFGLSLVIGVFFPFQAMGASLIFVQPTLWILALFSLRPIGNWLGRNRGNPREIVLWGMLGLTWVQAMVAFNVCSEAVFSQETVHVLQEVRRAASPNEVVAYLPSNLRQKPIWGQEGQSTDFSIMAMTGLDGYFSNEEYSTFSAVPGLSGRSPEEVLAKAKQLYEQRRDDVESFVRGDITAAGSSRLAEDHVRWIVISCDALRSVSSRVTPWRRTDDVVVYRLGESGS